MVLHFFETATEVIKYGLMLMGTCFRSHTANPYIKELYGNSDEDFVNDKLKGFDENEYRKYKISIG